MRQETDDVRSRDGRPTRKGRNAGGKIPLGRYNTIRCRAGERDDARDTTRDTNVASTIGVLTAKQAFERACARVR